MTAPDGPYSVIRWGRNWSIENILDRHAKQPRYDSQHQAQTEADKRNSAYGQAHAPRPAAPDLFSSQEAT